MNFKKAIKLATAFVNKHPRIDEYRAAQIALCLNSGRTKSLEIAYRLTAKRRSK